MTPELRRKAKNLRLAFLLAGIAIGFFAVFVGQRVL